jgi:AcrR family transcriptional regulator
MPAERAPRRLSSEARREQLATVAQELAARDGYASFSLDEVAERADVTRNLLYHYFPRGRLDLFLAAVHLGGEQLTSGWVTDIELSIEARLAANFGRMIEHAAAPSPAWLVYRQARAMGEPEVVEALGTYLERVVASVSLNHLGTEDPPPLARVAIGAYLAFAERALDEARELGVPRDQVLALLGETLVATIAATGR